MIDDGGAHKWCHSKLVPTMAKRLKVVHFGPISCLTGWQSSKPSLSFRQLLVLFILVVVAVTEDTRQQPTDAAPKVQSETHLYQLIRAREWNVALELLEADDSEASVLIERRGADASVILRHFPLHQALVIDIAENHHNQLLPRTNMPDNQVEFLDKLLSSYPQAAGTVDLQQRTPLHLLLYSAVLPPVHLVKALIDAYPTALSARDVEGRLPLHAAAYHPITSYNNFLTVYNAHPGAATAMDEDEAYPLHLLAWGGNYPDALPILQLLVRHNTASLFTKDGDEETPLALMAKYGKTSSEALRFVLRHQPTNGAQMDRNEYEGNTVLHFAVSASHGPNNTVLGPLLEAYPRMAQEINRIGMLPLHTALWKCCVPLRVVERLLAVYPQATSFKDGLGFLPIHYACQEGVSDPKIVQLLLETSPATVRQGAVLHPDQKIDNVGPLPLHLALGYTIKTDSNDDRKMIQHMNSVIFLLLREYGQGARIPEPDSGLFPLHLAILSGRPLALILKLTQLYPHAVSVPITVPKDIGIGSSLSALHLFLSMAPRLYSSDEDQDGVRNVIMEFHRHDPSIATRIDDQGRIPLHHAWQAVLERFEASSRTVSSLVQTLLDVDPTIAKILDRGRHSPLALACRARDHTSAQLLLSLYPEGAQIKSKTTKLPLHEACTKNFNDLRWTERDDNDFLEWNRLLLSLIQAYPMASSQADDEGNLPLHKLCLSVIQDKILNGTVQGLVDAFPQAVQIPGSDGQLPLHKAILTALSADNLDDTPYIVGQVRLLLDVYPAGASMTDGQGRTALARLFRSMKTLSPLREQGGDPILEIAKLLYERYAEAVLEKDRKGRNALHFGAIFAGHIGGALTDEWALFLQEIVHDYPEILGVSDNDQRTPLHLLMLYLGDTAIGDREGGTKQPASTRHFSSPLEGIIQSMLEAFPAALDLQERYELTPYDLITHDRLKLSRGGKAYARSPIIGAVSRMLQRGGDYWSLVHSLRRLESVELLQQDEEDSNCHALESELVRLNARIVGELERNARHPQDIDVPIPGEQTCAPRQRHLCETCGLSELLASISFHLSLLSWGLDNQATTEQAS